MSYLKGIVAAVAATAITLESAYPSWRWLPAVTAGVAALGVVWARNQSGGKP